jgi:hypothetical protein
VVSSNVGEDSDSDKESGKTPSTVEESHKEMKVKLPSIFNYKLGYGAPWVSMRIRIQHCRSMGIRIQGFDEQKLYIITA